MMYFLLAALGGGIGAAARYGVGLLLTRPTSTVFPLGTLVVNWLGSFLIGLLIVAVARRLDAPHGAQVFLITGVLGGFTTFSAFSLDTLYLVEKGFMSMALIYVLLSVFGAILACFSGLFLGRLVF